MTTQNTSATNVQGPNLSVATPSGDSTQYFNNFYSGDFSFGAVNDTVTAYFEEYTGNAIAGKNLAGAVLYTARAQGLDPMAVLDSFQKVGRNQLSSFLAAFLNVNRIPTSSIGVRTGTPANETIQRTILPL